MSNGLSLLIYFSLRPDWTIFPNIIKIVLSIIVSVLDRSKIIIFPLLIMIPNIAL